MKTKNIASCKTLSKMKKIVLLPLFCAGSLWGFDITSSQTGNAEILIPEKAIPSTHRAAVELSTYIEKMTGKKLTIANGQSTAEKQIIIGTLSNGAADIPADIREKLAKSSSTESFFIRAKGNRLYIIGKDRVAEVFGVSALLEEQLGVRWLKAADKDDDYEYIPKLTDAKIKDGDIFQEPCFKWRKVSETCSSSWRKIPKQSAWWFTHNRMQFAGGQMDNPDEKFSSFYDEMTVPQIKNGMGGHGLFDHAIVGGEQRYNKEKVEKLFADHPEYFAMIDGKRVTTIPGGNVQFCTTNPEVKQIVLNYILDHFKKYGTAESRCLFGTSDYASGFCECPECVKLDGGTLDKGNVSGRMHVFFEEMSKLVYEKCPEARLHLWAYSIYRKPVAGITVDPRMEIEYCTHGRCYGHRLNDPACSRNAKILAEIREWQKKQPKIHTYEYETCTPMLYVPSELRLADDLKFYKKLGFTGWSEEGNLPDAATLKYCMAGSENYPSCWQWIYVASKLLWNPDLDPKAILEDIESKYYGKAYPAMKKYHDLRRTLWENLQNCCGYPWGDSRRPMLLNSPGSKDTLLGYLDEAQKLAGDDAKLQHRIAVDRDYLTRFWIEPNEKLKKIEGSTICAATVSNPVTIDGKAAERDWLNAGNTDKFMSPGSEKLIPDELKTRVSVLSDDDNLYFFIEAKEPSPEKMKADGKKDGDVWGDDGVEIFLMSPNPAGNYYHIAVNTKNEVYDSMCPGENTELDLGVEAKTVISEGRYVMEIKIPVKKHAGSEFARGGIWKFMVGRNRTVQDNLPNGCFSIDGGEYHTTSTYRCLEIGLPYLKNGSFSQVENGKPKFWSVRRHEIIKTPNGNAIRLNGSDKEATLEHFQIDPVLLSTKEPIKLSVRFQASGKGQVRCMFYRYAVKGSQRTTLKTKEVGKFKLNETPTFYSGSFTLNPGEYVALAFRTHDVVTIQNVSINKE